MAVAVRGWLLTMLHAS